MACCLLAAFLFAQCMAMLRRWGMFWGLVPTPSGEIPDTAYTRLKGWFARPVVRWAVAAGVAIELGLLGVWTYTEHGTHIVEIADTAWARLHGKQVVYAGTCGPTKGSRIRLVARTGRYDLLGS